MVLRGKSFVSLFTAQPASSAQMPLLATPTTKVSSECVTQDRKRLGYDTQGRIESKKRERKRTDNDKLHYFALEPSRPRRRNEGKKKNRSS